MSVLQVDRVSVERLVCAANFHQAEVEPAEAWRQIITTLKEYHHTPHQYAIRCPLDLGPSYNHHAGTVPSVSASLTEATLLLLPRPRHVTAAPALHNQLSTRYASVAAVSGH